MSTIADGTCTRHLNLLLEFLAAWEKRPKCLTQMACQWGFTIAKAVARLGPGEIRIGSQPDLEYCALRGVRLRPKDLENWRQSEIATAQFSAVRSDRDSGGNDGTHRKVQYDLPHLTLHKYLLSIILEVGFRLTGVGPTWGGIHLDDTSHYEWIFETAFSSDDDEIVADAMRMWIVSDIRAPLPSFARVFTKRLERKMPFSQGLRPLITRVVERIWDSAPWESGPETVHLLNRLDTNMDGLKKYRLVDLLKRVVRGSGGLKLSSHYWGLLDRSVVVEGLS